MLTVTDTARVSTNTPALPPLSPAQAEAYERLEEAIASSPVVVLESSVGFGKSFLVQRLMRRIPERKIPDVESHLSDPLPEHARGGGSRDVDGTGR